jgi:hypothetical protein
MIDKTKLHIPLRAAQDLTARLTDYRRRDTNTGTGMLGAMRVDQNLDGITIQGSLAKYLQGENITPLSLAGIREAIEKLETETGLLLKGGGGEAVVRTVEVGTSVIVKEKPSEYLRLFGDPPVYKKSVHSKDGCLETVAYGTPTGAFQFSAYDKGREMAGKRQAVPPLFSGQNVLRLEYRIIRQRGIRARFRRDLTPYDLFDNDIYRKLQELFLREYEKIPKTGRVCFIDTSKQITPARLEELCAEQYRQLLPLKYNADLQVLREAGAVTDKNFRRIRRKDRQRCRDISISDKSLLIAELDALVHGTFLEDFHAERFCRIQQNL